MREICTSGVTRAAVRKGRGYSTDKTADGIGSAAAAELPQTAVFIAEARRRGSAEAVGRG
jgi:hypothetical protein